MKKARGRKMAVNLAGLSARDKTVTMTLMLRHATYHLAILAHQFEFKRRPSFNNDELVQMALLYDLSEKLVDRLAPNTAERKKPSLRARPTR